LAGESFRLIAPIKFSAAMVVVTFIGAHAEYDRIDALPVSQV